MTLILIRADSQEKLLNGIADIERYAKLKIIGKPKLLDPEFADKASSGILKQKIRSKSKIAAVVNVEDDITKSIMNIKKIHPPAHLIVMSDEYKQSKELENLFKTLPNLKGYYSLK